MYMIPVRSYSAKIKPMYFAYLGITRFNIINRIFVLKEPHSVFNVKNRIKADFIHIMAFCSYLNHLYAEYAISLKLVPCTSQPQQAARYSFKSKFAVMDLAGLEPAASALRRQRSTTDLQALNEVSSEEPYLFSLN
jgi:hypothetical protein